MVDILEVVVVGVLHFPWQEEVVVVVEQVVEHNVTVVVVAAEGVEVVEVAYVLGCISGNINLMQRAGRTLGGILPQSAPQASLEVA